jgi:stage V sporulation protein B
MSNYATDAVALYGLFSGGAVTMINLPVSVCYGIAAASVPAVSRAATQAKENSQTNALAPPKETLKERKNPVRKKVLFSLFLTIAIAAPCAVGLYFFAAPAVKIVFKSLRAEEREIMIALVKAFSISALTLSCVQTLSACLTAQGKPKFSVISMTVAVAVKTAIEFFLLQNPKISVFALAYATNLCYFVAFLLNLIYNLYISKARSKRHDHGNRVRE